MKIPKRAIHLMVALEGIILIIVLVVAVLNPIKNVVVENKDFQKNEQMNPVVSTPVEAESQQETEQEIEQETEEQVSVQRMNYSEAVQAKVASMSLEEKVAQMFITTPEALTDMRQVTATGNTTKNAISAIPVGGLWYSSLNFAGSIQTASMTNALQTYYMEQFGMPLFMMVSEIGGAEGSPLAAGNGFAIEKSPAEIGAENNAELAASTAMNIAAYMTNQELNTNIGLGGGYSADETVAAAMLDATLKAYKEAGLYVATTVYHGAADIILLRDTLPFSDTVYSLRYDKQYQGILLADTLTDTESFIQAINDGADMVYCTNDLKTTYQAVVDAVNDGTINEELINEAVMRILTYKGYE